MTQAIMVQRSDSGTYEIPGAATQEDWDEVKAEAGEVERYEDLKGWGEWTSVYRVHLGDPVAGDWEAWYFVADESDGDNQEPESVTVCAGRGEGRVIAFVRTDRFPESVRAELRGQGIWGAWRDEDGRVVVTDKSGDDHETEIRISPDGYVFG